MVLGVSVGSSMQKWMLKSAACGARAGEWYGGKDSAGVDCRSTEDWILIEQIDDRVLSDVSYVGRLEGALRGMVVGSYVESLECSHGT
jgi:hypothetical protein